MKKIPNKVIYILLAIIVIILLWLLLKDRVFNKELIFKVDENIEIKIGNNEQINYELNEELNIVWESENESVAKVNNGVVTGVGLGSTNIKATVEKKKQKTTRVTKVSTYYGDKESNLNEIIVPEGELFITKGDSYEIPISYNPNNSYIKSIEYNVTDSNIVDFDGKVIAKEVGETTITITVNNNISKNIIVNVIGEKIDPIFSKKVTDLELDVSDITLKPSEKKEIKYNVIPEGAYVRNVKWESSNPSIATIEDGVVLAKSSGETLVKLTINDEIIKEIKVSVIIPVTGLNLLSNPKIVLKVGEQEKIKTSIVPANATNKTLKYESTGGVSIDNNGVITGLSPATGTIAIKTLDGGYTKTISYVVNPKIGVVNGTGGVWGYTSPLDKVPTRADESFFRSLASSGKGTLSGNVYYYTDANHTYKYDISKSTLNYEGHNILMRLYYPEGVDLSEVNIFTFMGGSGERNMSGYFAHLDQHREELKSSGIVALVSAKENYNVKDAIGTTTFIRSITGQKSDRKNTVGVYSMSGQAAGEAALSGMYSKIFIVNSYSGKIEEYKNIDVVVFSPVGDSMLKNTRTTLTHLVRSNYTRVTVITNNKELYGNEFYNTKFLMVNPGYQMGSGHGYVNISKANVFSLANS